MTAPKPLRVFHTISGLSGGGLERWLSDIIRLSDPSEVEHRVFVFYPDLGGSPVYYDELVSRGVVQARGSGLWFRLQTGFAALGRTRKSTALQRRLSFVSRGAACLLALPRALRDFKDFRPDLIHAHSGPDILLGILLKARFRRPLVHTVPCLFSQMQAEGLAWLPDFYRRSHHKIDVFSTGEAKTELMGIGVPAEKILYDLGGVDLDESRRTGAARDEAREMILGRLNLPADALLALSAGRLHSSKGHAHAIDVLARLVDELPQLHLLILGEGAERGALERQARQLGVEDRVHLLGFIRDPQAIFEAADVFLRTTILEPENLTFYEAMAAGLPVVGFDTGWPDLIDKVGHGKLVAIQDVASFARAVREIMALPDRGRALGQAGRAYAVDRLSVRSSVDLLTDTYKRLATMNGSSGDHAACG